MLFNTKKIDGQYKLSDMRFSFHYKALNKHTITLNQIILAYKTNTNLLLKLHHCSVVQGPPDVQRNYL